MVNLLNLALTVIQAPSLPLALALIQRLGSWVLEEDLEVVPIPVIGGAMLHDFKVWTVPAIRVRATD